MNSGCWGRWQQVHRRHGAWDQGIDQHGAVIRKFLIAMEICPAKHGHPTSFGECKLDIVRFSFIGKRIWGMGLNLSWTARRLACHWYFRAMNEQKMQQYSIHYGITWYHQLSVPTISEQNIQVKDGEATPAGTFPSATTGMKTTTSGYGLIAAHTGMPAKIKWL
jgi:hypothetical protein